MAKVVDAGNAHVDGSKKGETVVVAVRNDAASIQALKWVLGEYSKAGRQAPLNFMLLHVVSDISVSKSKNVRVSEASTEMVAVHLRDQVLPFLESMQDLCDLNEVVSSIEVVKDDLAPEAIIHSAKRLKADSLYLGGSKNTTTWGTIAHCTAPGKSPPGCRVVVIQEGKKSREVTPSGQIFNFEQNPPEPNHSSSPGSARPPLDANRPPLTIEVDTVPQGSSLFSGKLRLLSGGRRPTSKVLVKQISEERRPIMEGLVSPIEGASRMTSILGQLSLSRSSRLSGNRSSSSSDIPPTTPGWGSPFVSPSRMQKEILSVEPPPWPFSEARGPPKGRIIVYSSSGTKDSLAVKALLRKKGAWYEDVNLDLFPERRREMESRCHRTSTPQVLFNGDHAGGLEAILALEQEGELDAIVEDVYDTPAPALCPLPVSTFPAASPSGSSSSSNSAGDDPDWAVYERVRKGLPLMDKLQGFQIHRQCFHGQQFVEWLQRRGQIGGTWLQASQTAKSLLQKCYMHSIPRPAMPLGVLRFPVFDDTPTALYKWTDETGELVPGMCLNHSGTGGTFRGRVRPGVEMVQYFAKVMQGLVDEFVSPDGKWVHYTALERSPHYQRFLTASAELQRVCLPLLSPTERLSFLLNVHNVLVCQLAIRAGSQLSNPVERFKLFSRHGYLIQGIALSVADINQTILHCVKRSGDSSGSFASASKDEKVFLAECEPLVRFALVDGSRSSPPLRVYHSSTLLEELRENAMDFFAVGGVLWDSASRQVLLSKLLAWQEKDFGKSPRDILQWISKFLEEEVREEFLKVIGDFHTVKVSYMEYDWTLNAWV